MKYFLIADNQVFESKKNEILFLVQLNNHDFNIKIVHLNYV